MRVVRQMEADGRRFASPARGPSSAQRVPRALPRQVQAIRELEAAGRLCQGRVEPSSQNDSGKCAIAVIERRHPDTGDALGRYCANHFRRNHPEVASMMVAREASARRERRDSVYRMVHDEQLTLAEISDRLGVSRERVRHILHDAERERRRSLRAAPPPAIQEHLALRLSQRTHNCLKRHQIATPERVRAMTDDELLSLRNFGEGALREVRAAFGPHDPTSGDWCPNWVGEAVPA
jgi:AraC-like DNA-binding protein